MIDVVIVGKGGPALKPEVLQAWRGFCKGKNGVLRIIDIPEEKKRQEGLLATLQELTKNASQQRDRQIPSR